MYVSYVLCILNMYVEPEHIYTFGTAHSWDESEGEIAAILHAPASPPDLHNDQRLSCLSKLFSAICIIFLQHPPRLWRDDKYTNTKVRQARKRKDPPKSCFSPFFLCSFIERRRKRFLAQRPLAFWYRVVIHIRSSLSELVISLTRTSWNFLVSFPYRGKSTNIHSLNSFDASIRLHVHFAQPIRTNSAPCFPVFSPHPRYSVRRPGKKGLWYLVRNSIRVRSRRKIVSDSYILSPCLLREGCQSISTLLGFLLTQHMDQKGDHR